MESPMIMKNLRYGGRFMDLLTLLNTGCWIGDGCICCFYLQRTGDERKSFEKKGSLLVYGLEDFRH